MTLEKQSPVEKSSSASTRLSIGARLWASFVGGLAEAWSEIRVHRTQVLLSLIGVGIAVTALTGVVAAGAIATQASTVSRLKRHTPNPDANAAKVKPVSR